MNTFEDPAGNSSSKRILAYVSLLCAVAITIFDFILKQNHLGYVTTFIGLTVGLQGVSAIQDTNLYGGGKLSNILDTMK